MRNRTALALDLENLLHPYRECGRMEEGTQALLDALARYRAISDVVGAVGFCDRSLQRLVAFPLGEFGIRVHGHDGGALDLADELLIEYIEGDLPRSTMTLVLGSGDHIFASTVRHQRERGRRVEVLGPCGGIASLLRSAADSVTVFGPWEPTPPALQPAA